MITPSIARYSLSRKNTAIDEPQRLDHYRSQTQTSAAGSQLARLRIRAVDPTLDADEARETWEAIFVVEPVD